MDREIPAVVLPVLRHLQQESWSCGTASLKIVLDSLGRHVGEHELIEICGAAAHHGTPPHAMVLGLQYLGVIHELVDSGSIDELSDRVRRLQLCIVDYQSWGRSGRDYARAHTGHYSVVYGVDRTHLFIADPAKGKRKPGRANWGMRRVRKDLFEKRWHDLAADGARTERWMLCVPMHQGMAIL